MTLSSIALYAVFLFIVLVLVKPLGGYLARVFAGERTFFDPALRPVERFIFLSNVNGISLADGSHLSEINATQAHALIDEGVIYGGMIPKITACLDALTDVPRVHIVDGGTPHVLLYELEDHPHVGTTITR
jgi:isopentenyl phosphate kinase